MNNCRPLSIPINIQLSSSIVNEFLPSVLVYESKSREKVKRWGYPTFAVASLSISRSELSYHFNNKSPQGLGLAMSTFNGQVLEFPDIRGEKEM